MFRTCRLSLAVNRAAPAVSVSIVAASRARMAEVGSASVPPSVPPPPAAPTRSRRGSVTKVESKKAVTVPSSKSPTRKVAKRKVEPVGAAEVLGSIPASERPSRSLNLVTIHTSRFADCISMITAAQLGPMIKPVTTAVFNAVRYDPRRNAAAESK
jgi:hypothetical protein